MLATLARATEPKPTHPPRTHTAIVLVNTGAIAVAAGAVTFGVGAWLFSSPFAHDGPGCIPPKLQGQSACGTYTLWPGLALGTVGALAMTLSLPLIPIGLRLPRDHSDDAAETGSFYMGAGFSPGGIRLEGIF